MTCRRFTPASALAASALCLALAGAPAHAQVINGESTSDSGFAPSPPARWSAPNGESDIDLPQRAEPDAAPIQVNPARETRVHRP